MGGATVHVTPSFGFGPPFEGGQASWAQRPVAVTAKWHFQDGC
jgi:hypothetical protein